MSRTVPRLGAWRTDSGGAAWRVWAPEHDRLAVVLCDDERAGSESFALHREGSYFEGELPCPPARLLYKLLVDGGGPFPDPWSRSQPFGVHGPSEVPINDYRWHDRAWRGVPLDQLIIYELHVGAATTEGTFDSLIPRLQHVRSLGATALELMPVASFPGRRNWGYDGVSLFAPSVVYGGPDALRRLIDVAHQVGLAVILDVVYNHLGPDGNYLGCFSADYFTARHTTPWGKAINYDGERAAPVRELVLSNAEMWIGDYHADGLRLDATHAIFDDSGPHILREIGERARGAAPERSVIVIAEDDRNDARLVGPAPGYGLDAVWADDFHHALRRTVAGDSMGYYRDYRGTTEEIAASIRQGWLYEGQYSEHFGRARGTSSTPLPLPQFVHCLQNHDQIGNRALGDRISEAVSPAVHRVMSALLFFSPGTPLLFMGQEWDARTPFLFFTDHHAELGRHVTEGRRAELFALGTPSTTEIPDPQAEETFTRSRLDWKELDRPGHREMLAWYRCLIELRRTHPCLQLRRREDTEAVALSDSSLRIVRRSGDRRLTLVACFGGALEFATIGRVLASSTEPRFGGETDLRVEGGRVCGQGPVAVVLEG